MYNVISSFVQTIFYSLFIFSFFLFFFSTDYFSFIIVVLHLYLHHLFLFYYVSNQVFLQFLIDFIIINPTETSTFKLNIWVFNSFASYSLFCYDFVDIYNDSLFNNILLFYWSSFSFSWNFFYKPVKRRQKISKHSDDSVGRSKKLNESI